MLLVCQHFNVWRLEWAVKFFCCGCRKLCNVKAFPCVQYDSGIHSSD